MTSMTAAPPTGLPHGRPLTRADLESMPDDGHRYELIDGTLVVTPSPAFRHQHEPDLLVARREDFAERDLPVAPLLAVEILSPSTRRIDLMLKRSRYEAAGTASYWVVDADVPSVTAWEQRDGAYVLTGEATGNEELSLTLPFPVTLVPARLVEG